MVGFFGLKEEFQLEAKTEPVSTIEKSGALKSPGGTSEATEQRRIRVGTM